MKRIFIDMDGVLADFEGGRTSDKKRRNPPEMYSEGFFENLEPIPGALEAMQELHQSGKYDLWIATKPVATSPRSYTEKVNWIAKNLPYMLKKVVLTQDKSFLEGNVLIDDNFVEGFGGIQVKFETDAEDEWKSILDLLEAIL